MALGAIGLPLSKRGESIGNSVVLGTCVLLSLRDLIDGSIAGEQSGCELPREVQVWEVSGQRADQIATNVLGLKKLSDFGCAPCSPEQQLCVMKAWGKICGKGPGSHGLVASRPRGLVWWVGVAFDRAHNTALPYILKSTSGLFYQRE